ncbi:Protein-L-isoaspartate O-methyltransferase [uncultured archaeon]|nr:Protein-L-isoaspartate O-methyltransferase [uncultured archaeon]
MIWYVALASQMCNMTNLLIYSICMASVASGMLQAIAIEAKENNAGLNNIFENINKMDNISGNTSVVDRALFNETKEKLSIKKGLMLEGMRGRINNRVIYAMERVPRELFIPADLRMQAYDDTPLPIGYGQTISSPDIVAKMCDLLDLQDGMNVLEVGGGSGYHAAVMASLVGPEGHIYSVERIHGLVVRARENLKKAGITNVVMIEADGSLGLPEYAPYDRISVAASAPQIPEPLKQQLKVGGKMVIPVGATVQGLYLVIKTDENNFVINYKMRVIFVPIIGENGFKNRS